AQVDSELKPARWGGGLHGDPIPHLPKKHNQTPQKKIYFIKKNTKKTRYTNPQQKNIKKIKKKNLKNKKPPPQKALQQTNKKKKKTNKKKKQKYFNIL
ncbi:hypothetical protein ACVGWG_05875, partial [Enterobacter asburiae]